MKKVTIIVLLLVIVVFLSSCPLIEANKMVRITDISQYGNDGDRVEFPAFFPKNVDNYTVNSYTFIEMPIGDPRHEYFLDVTVSQEEFDTLISSLKSFDDVSYESEAYYADGYYEIIFRNNTTDDHDDIVDGDSDPYIISYTGIKKVVYNPKTLNIVFVDFEVFDAYKTSEIEYFKRFGIEWATYIDYMDNGY